MSELTEEELKEFEELKKERLKLPENVGNVTTPNGGNILFTTFDGGNILESNLCTLPQAEEELRKLITFIDLEYAKSTGQEKDTVAYLPHQIRFLRNLPSGLKEVISNHSRQFGVNGEDTAVLLRFFEYDVEYNTHIPVHVDLAPFEDETEF